MKIKTRDMILVALFAALTAVGAFIKIPLYIVPFTLLFMFCAFSGLLLGARLGALSQIVYVVIGLAGVPVFTKGGGLNYVFQPTFGYLIGIIIASYVIGKITENKKLTFVRALTAALIGLIIVYIIGATYLYMIMSFYLHKKITVYWAVKYGILLFIGGDTVSSIITAAVSCRVVPRLKKEGII